MLCGMLHAPTPPLASCAPGGGRAHTSLRCSYYQAWIEAASDADDLHHDDSYECLPMAERCSPRRARRRTGTVRRSIRCSPPCNPTDGTSGVPLRRRCVHCCSLAQHRAVPRLRAKLYSLVGERLGHPPDPTRRAAVVSGVLRGTPTASASLPSNQHTHTVSHTHTLRSLGLVGGLGSPGSARAQRPPRPPGVCPKSCAYIGQRGEQRHPAAAAVSL
jgi:hypothetical protein